MTADNVKHTHNALVSGVMRSSVMEMRREHKCLSYSRKLKAITPTIPTFKKVSMFRGVCSDPRSKAKGLEYIMTYIGRKGTPK